MPNTFWLFPETLEVTTPLLRQLRVRRQQLPAIFRNSSFTQKVAHYSKLFYKIYVKEHVILSTKTEA